MQQGQPTARLEVGRHGGLLSWSRRSGPHVTFLPTVSRSQRAVYACQPSAAAPRPRPLRCGPGFTHHSLSRLRSEAEHPEGLALTGSGTLGVPAREAATSLTLLTSLRA